MSLLNSPQNSTDYIQTVGFSPCTLFPDLLPPNPLADLLTISSNVTIKTTMSPQPKDKQIAIFDIKKIYKKFSAVLFVLFLALKPWIRIRNRNRIRSHLQCWIRIWVNESG